MLEVAGGKPSKAKVAGAPPVTTDRRLRSGARREAGRLALPEKQIRATLTALGFAIDGKGPTVKATVPSWRPDIHGAADLVEEVVRIAGLDKVPSAPMPR
jgi:phenylalanyl-tRNA synthetase beta chain